MAQIDNPEDDIDDSINFPDIRFVRSAFTFDPQEPYPDATLLHSWLVPDGGNLFYYDIYSIVLL